MHAILVNTQTHTDRQILTSYTISSASLANNNTDEVSIWIDK